jgi:acyl-coenzyme A synthetase/AMP-(fatty) acid ligase
MTICTWYDNFDENYFQNIIKNGVNIYTSGSSGTPKKIFQPPKKIHCDAQNACEVQGITQDSKIYTCLNPCKAGGLFAQTIPGLLAGAKIDLEKFNPYRYVKVAGKYTHTHLTPKQAKGVMATKGFKQLDLTNKTFLIGSEPVTFDIIDAFIDKGATVICIWGMTEIGVNAIMHRIYNKLDIEFLKKIAPKKTTILGNIFNCEYKIDKDNCLWVKGSNSVYNNWFNTKDTVIEDNGYLWYTGRYGIPVDFNKPRKG